MRTWGSYPPEGMCRQHLLGEHFEIHCFVGMLRNGVNLDTPKWRRLVEPGHLRTRHDELVMEMLKRGLKHNSPLPMNECTQPLTIPADSVVRELLHRCWYCYQRYWAMSVTRQYHTVEVLRVHWEGLTPEPDWYPKPRIGL